MMKNREAVIVAYGRSAVTRAKKGSFVGIHPLEWMAQVLNGVLDQVPQIERREISDLILGCARHENKLNRNAARLLALRAGLPDEVCGRTINRFCASGLQAIADCVYAIEAGSEDIMIAGGVEQMSMELTRGDTDLNEWLSRECPGAYMAMGITAENVAEKYGVARKEMDLFAVESHKKAAIAQENGNLQKSIIPVKIETESGETKEVRLDEGIRVDTNSEKLAALKPCFKENGVVTAGTSSQTSDGTAFAVIMEKQKALSLGIKPLARLVSFAVAGCNPEYMGLGPMYAVPKVMKKSGLSVEQMDVIEINEAFAAQAIPCIKELKLPMEKVNPWGGAIALGHPMGATGCILMEKAIDYLNTVNGTYALVTMCIGGGMGAAGIFERL